MVGFYSQFKIFENPKCVYWDLFPFSAASSWRSILPSAMLFCLSAGRGQGSSQHSDYCLYKANLTVVIL